LGSKRLLIVSQGKLQYIPFEILPDPATLNTPAEPTHLFIDHEIAYLPSASVMTLLHREAVGRKQASSAVAVFADPVFDKNDPRVWNSANLTKPAYSDETSQILTRLPATAWEANKITSVVPAGSVMKAVGFEASRQAVMSSKLNDFRIIHFATHGVINKAHPALSGIVLSLVDAYGQQQNGVLSLSDISALKLSADLVVLSACDTGLGKDIEGEGMMGLTQSFLSVGVQGVVTSLWKVDDSATADLMARFYKGMLTDGLAPAAALRQAKIQMSRTGPWRQPYYWAAFTLQGDGSRNLALSTHDARHLSYGYISVLLPIGSFVVLIFVVGTGSRISGIKRPMRAANRESSDRVLERRYKQPNRGTQ